MEGRPHTGPPFFLVGMIFISTRSLVSAIGLCLAVASFSASAAEEVPILYAERTLELLTEPGTDAPAAGRVYVATQLAVLERGDGWLQVELSGWHQENSKRALYALPGKRILVAALKPAAVERLRALDAVTDPETGITWNGAAFQGWIRNEDVTADLGEIWQDAWELFATRCTACHQRRIPHKYTANQWVSLLKVMGPRTGLPKEQQQLILKYLQNHAKDTSADKP